MSAEKTYLQKPELDLRYRKLSFESMNQGPIAVTDSLKMSLTNFVVETKSYIHELLNPRNDVQRFDFKPNRKLDNTISTIPFMSLADIGIYVPSGMTAKCKDFADAINGCSMITEQLILDILKPATMYFSSLLAHPENLTSVSGYGEHNGINFHRGIDKAKKVLADCYTPNTATTERRFGEVFNSVGEWNDYQKRLEELTLRYKQTPAGEVMHYVNDLTQIMDKLVIRVQAKPEGFAISGVSANILANVTVQIAQEVEFYAATGFTLQTAIAAMDDTQQKLLRNLGHQ